MLSVNWKGGMAFEANPPSGNRFVIDASPDSGGADLGPTPVETLLSSVAACSAMDVISILRKKRQNVESYHVEVEWERVPPGDWPRPITSMTVRHVFKGEGLDPAAVAHAVELSDQKYCSVIATFRQCPTVRSEWRVDGLPEQA